MQFDATRPLTHSQRQRLKLGKVMGLDIYSNHLESQWSEQRASSRGLEIPLPSSRRFQESEFQPKKSSRRYDSRERERAPRRDSRERDRASKKNRLDSRERSPIRESNRTDIPIWSDRNERVEEKKEVKKPAVSLDSVFDTSGPKKRKDAGTISFKTDEPKDPKRPVEWDHKKALRDHEMKLRKLQEEQEKKEEEDKKAKDERMRQEKKATMRGGLSSIGSVQPREAEVATPVIEQLAAQAKTSNPFGKFSAVEDFEDMDLEARIAAVEARVDAEVDAEEDAEEGPEDGKGESGGFDLKKWRNQRKQRQKEEELRRKTKKKKKKDKKLDPGQDDFEDDDAYERKKEEEFDEEASRSRSPPQSEKRGGPLMTEAQVMAMMKRGKKVERGSETARLRIAKEKEEWEEVKKWKPMEAPVVNVAYASGVKLEDARELRRAKGII